MRKAKELLVEFFHADNSLCLRCQMSEQGLEASLKHLKEIIKNQGYKVVFKKIAITSKKDARKYQFKTSPTIKINSQDIEEVIHGEPRHTKNYCGSCSSVSGEDKECRTFYFDDKTYQYIPRRMIVEAIKKVIGVFDEFYK